MNTPPHIHAGIEIPYFSEGEDEPQIMSSEAMNRIVSVANAVTKARIRFGGRLAISVSERGMVIEIPRQTAGAGTSGGLGLHPFKIYHPPGAPANTFRVHGGYVIVPEFFPASTTPRLVPLLLMKGHENGINALVAVDGTDGVTDNSESTGSGANDIVLSNWNSGGGFTHPNCGIWITIYQSAATAGAMQVLIEHNYNTLRPFTTHITPGLGEIITTVPVGIITPTGFGPVPEDPSGPIDLASSTITQLLHSAVTGTYSATPARNRYTYTDDQFYLPGDIVFWVADGKTYIQSQPNGYASIGYSPLNSPEVVWTPLT